MLGVFQICIYLTLIVFGTKDVYSDDKMDGAEANNLLNQYQQRQFELRGEISRLQNEIGRNKREIQERSLQFQQSIRSRFEIFQESFSTSGMGLFLLPFTADFLPPWLLAIAVAAPIAYSSFDALFYPWGMRRLTKREIRLAEAEIADDTDIDKIEERFHLLQKRDLDFLSHDSEEYDRMEHVTSTARLLALNRLYEGQLETYTRALTTLAKKTSAIENAASANCAVQIMKIGLTTPPPNIRPSSILQAVPAQ